MGFYIETPVNKGKAEYLVNNHGAVRLSGYMPVAEAHEVLICVVDNGPFEAAGIMYSLNEVESFNDEQDRRPKEWLLMTKEEVINLHPMVAEVME